jgi:hypothetical protein
VDNTEIDLIERVCEDVDCIHMAQDRVMWRGFVNTGSIKGGKFID